MADKNPNVTNFEAGVQRQDLPTFKEHDRLGASHLNLIVNAVEDTNQMLSEHGAYGRLEGIGRIRAYNVGAAIDAWQLVELSDISEWDPIIPDCRVPTADGLELLALTLDRIEPDTAGWVCIYGTGIVQCPVGAVVGDHLGSATGSTIPQADSDGPLIVIGTFVEDGTTYAVVIWAAGSGGAVVGVPRMIQSLSNMITDNTNYSAGFLDSDGTVGVGFAVKRPNGVRVELGDTGFLGVDSSDDYIFIPCHARLDYNLGLMVERRTSDPGDLGRIYLRTDL